MFHGHVVEVNKPESLFLREVHSNLQIFNRFILCFCIVPTWKDWLPDYGFALPPSLLLCSPGKALLWIGHQLVLVDQRLGIVEENLVLKTVPSSSLTEVSSKLDDLLHRSGAIIIGWPWWSPGCLFAFWWTRFLVALFVAQHGQLNGLHIFDEYIDDDFKHS